MTYGLKNCTDDTRVNGPCQRASKSVHLTLADLFVSASTPRIVIEFFGRPRGLQAVSLGDGSFHFLTAICWVLLRWIRNTAWWYAVCVELFVSKGEIAHYYLFPPESWDVPPGSCRLGCAGVLGCAARSCSAWVVPPGSCRLGCAARSCSAWVVPPGSLSVPRRLWYWWSDICSALNFSYFFFVFFDIVPCVTGADPASHGVRLWRGGSASTVAFFLFFPFIVLVYTDFSNYVSAPGLLLWGRGEMAERWSDRFGRCLRAAVLSVCSLLLIIMSPSLSF